MDIITLKIKRLSPNVPIPTYAYEGDAAFDLYCREDVTVQSGERVAVPTGIAMAIPDGFVGLVWDKSGIAIKKGLKTLGGVIDSGYRGEVLVGIYNTDTEPFMFKAGEKVAQMIIQKKEVVRIEEVDELDDDTHRGDKGFGSSGA
jgi:dUTP pyrophosphatase